jgi:nicotinamidase-related amidase
MKGAIGMNSIDNTVFILVDVQGKLAQVMHEKEALFDNLQRLIKGMQILKVPMIWMEQTPEKMGRTTTLIASLLPEEKPISKSSFSCCGCEAFVQKLESTGRKRVIVAGIEAHICIYQTAWDLVKRGYEVEVVADAVSSRVLSNKQIALDKIKACGAQLTSVEMVLFDLMQTADHPVFRDMLKIVK